ncbi:uncharacterized protein LOC122513852 isoform X1 [Polistes fuscatus]|uniref:uncharacterized protein LOC122513852 isoform X1 n=1 Tax=Polistes fuscatus TaxID=30207 RepID=UPI001CA9E9B5|nr:uncharacterized protein LOC122513852 isoform X1 [Polistes fuscatus]
MRIDCELMCSFFNIYTCMCVFYSGGMAGQHYCLRWNNYQSNMTSVFHQLLQNEAFVDVTLACNEASLKAHKVVLSACSSYFQKLLLSNPCKHPTIIMPQDVCFSDLKFIIEFVYRGEIDVSQAELQSLLKTADQLKIKGLCEVPESKDGPPSVSLSSPPREPGSQRFNFTRLKRPYPRYKRTRTSFEPRATDSRHYDRYKEEEDSDSYHRKNKENRRDWQVEDEECTEVAAAAAVVLESCQRNSNNSTNNANGTNNNNNNGDMFCHTGLGHYGHHPDPEVDLPPETQPTPPSATLVGTTITHLRDSDHHSTEIQNCDTVKIKFETLHTMDSSDTIDIDSHMSDRASVSSKNAADSDNMMMITPELLGLMPSGSSIHSDSGENNSRGHSGQSSSHHHGNKSWTQEDMDAALEALRNHDMSLTKASAAFGIPSTTLWQRAHRLGIDTPKKDGPTKSWSDESLNNALEALRTGTISANKASKAFGIPSSTLYKIARREGIRLAAPFNASPTTWTPADLDRALEAIRSGQTSVQRASTEFGIPTGTLYGRCKREGIELSRSNPTPWSEDAMTEALEAVRLGHMSINQAAIHYNLPYSSLYGRFKRGKYEEPVVGDLSQDGTNSHFHQSPTQNHSSTIPDQMSYQGS